MRHLFFCLWALILIAPLHGQEPPPAVARMGINLSGISDWETELPFLDVFKTARSWISQKPGAGWGQGPELALDARGWITRLEPGTFAETLFFTHLGDKAPEGRYVLTYEGDGDLEFPNNRVEILHQIPGRIEFSIRPGGGAVYLRLSRTNPETPLRGIRIRLPGFADAPETEWFHPAFLKRWENMSVIRFMDWMHTNNSKQQSWSDRPLVEDAVWTRAGGVPLEVMIALSNQTGVDPWFCMPHLADDDYVRNFARLVREKLDPERKVYVEYSNEVWNGQFSQSRWAGERGIELGFAEKPWEAAWRFTAHRSVEIFRIWEEVFEGKDRLVRVLPSQAANAYVSTQIVTFQEAWKSADALAIAPYFSMNIPGQSDREGALTAPVVAEWPVDRVLAHLRDHSLPESLRWMREQKVVADRHGLRMIAYEAGQHAVGVQGGENHEKLTALLQAANSHPLMYDLYLAYFDGWKEAGGDLMAIFSSVGSWSKWGSWSLLRDYRETAEQSPKFRAVQDWMARNRP